MINNEVHNILFNPSGGTVWMEIYLFPPRRGSYEFLQYDEQGSYQGPVMRGTNIARSTDTFPIPVQESELEGKYLEWRVVLSASNFENEQNYYIRITLLQNGANLTGSPIERYGHLGRDSLALGFIRLAADSTTAV